MVDGDLGIGPALTDAALPIPMTDTEHETKALLATCRALIRCALEISRSEDSPAGRRVQLSTARRCADLALLALQGGEVAVLAAAPVARTSMAANVADHLLQTLHEAGETVEPTEPARPSFDPVEGGGFSGSTEAIDIPDLLGFLQLQRKTGVLQIRLENESLTLEFMDGEVVCACSDNSPVGSRLGEILVDQGGIDKERLGSFLIDHAASSGKLGTALLTEELISEEHLRTALEFQVQEIFHRLFSSCRSTFQFHPTEISQVDGGLRMNVMQLLLESARVNDESSQAVAES